MATVFHLAPELRLTTDNGLKPEKETQIQESLISHIEQTNMVYYGGSVRTSEILHLKRLLFRSTRGHAVITQFDLVVDIED